MIYENPRSKDRAEEYNALLEEFWTVNGIAEGNGNMRLQLDEMNISAGSSSPISVRLPLVGSECTAVRELCSNSPALLFNFYATLASIVLYKYFGCAKLNFICPYRQFPEGAADHSFFLFRSSPAGGHSFKDMFSANKDFLKNALKYRSPYHSIAGILRRQGIEDAPDLCISVNHSLPENEDGFRPGLYFSISEDSGPPTVELLSAQHYCSEGIARLLIHSFEKLLGEVIGNLYEPLNDLDAENDLGQELSDRYCHNRADFPSGSSYVELFRAQAEKTPENIAVICGDRQLTYRELNNASTAVRNYLQKNHDIRPEDLVALQFGRSEWMAVCILGIFKCGAAYLPLNPDAPHQRVSYMLSDSRCKLVIDTAELDRIRQHADGHPETEAGTLSKPQHLAYVIYTSGSTGQPKGVMIEQVGMINHLYAKIRALNLREKSRVVQNAPHSFDISVWQFLAAWLCGGKTIIYEQQCVVDPPALLRAMRSDDPTVLEVVPSYLAEFLDILSSEPLDGLWRSLEYLAVTGEELKPSLVIRWYTLFPHIPLINAYGPTEASDDITHCFVENKPGRKRIPIGRPLQNLSIYIVDANMRRCPFGAKGEICVAGTGVGRGYINNSERTQEVFMDDPYVQEQGVRMYKTGDIGRYLENGELLYFGRKDDQVKIRGNRVEPGEIELILEKHPQIDQAVVIAVKDDSEEQTLVAFFTGHPELSGKDLRLYAEALLPAYMVPAHFVRLEKFTLNQNGKIDKTKLSELSGWKTGSRTLYVAPGNETENKLALLWEEITGVQKIGLKDNFFELGGHSLRATRLASRINKVFQVQLTLRDIFLHPVLEEQSRYISQLPKASYHDILPVREQDGYELSPSQHRLWIVCHLASANSAYNIPGAFIFEGDLDVEILNDCFTRLIARHESLRTFFSEDNQGNVRQYILGQQEVDFTIPLTDLRSQTLSNAMIRQTVRKEFIRPFDLSSAPLLRASLYRTEDHKWVFCYAMHHLISDGWSMNILIRELLILYNALTTGQPDPLPPLKIQYKDYAAWQKKQLDDRTLRTNKAYWTSRFEGPLPVLELPGDRTRPAVKTYNGGRVDSTIPFLLSQKWKALVSTRDSTLFMGLYAVVNILLYRYTGETDLILGTPVAGREHVDLEAQIGLYLNTIVLRTAFEPADTYRSLLEKVKETTLSAYEHQQYPFDELVESLGLQRDISRNPLFDVWIVLQDAQMDGPDQPSALGLLKAAELDGIDQLPGRFDLLFNFADSPDGIRASISYNSDIFDERTISRMSVHLRAILSAVTEEPDTSLSTLDFLDAGEKTFLLGHDYNDPELATQSGKTIAALFEEQVKQTPANTALVFRDTRLTYVELNEKANRLAGYLRANYVSRPDHLIGIHLQRSEWMIIAILAVLKSGGAYVPIDPEYPRERVANILKNCNAKGLINETELEVFSGMEGTFSGQDLSPINNSRDLAYVIYTSGSTGQPKGVMITNHAIIDYYFGILQRTNIGDCRRFGLASTISADLGNTVLYPSLLTGGELHIFSASDVMNGERMRQAGIDCLKIVPSHWKALQTPGNLFVPAKCLIFGGEQLTPDIVDLLKAENPPCKVYNHYGPSETTVGKLLRSIDLSDEKVNISLGTPIGRSWTYVLNASLGLCPIGVTGELHIGGSGLSTGYIGDPELNALKFIPDPYKKGEWLYKTGDLGKRLPDGNIAFVGRKDDQLKIRGFRVEPGEIEALLNAYKRIERSVVIAGPDTQGEKILVAYLVSTADIEITELKAWLAERLPSYMIPACFVRIDSLPLTSNGKPDKKALPLPPDPNFLTQTARLGPRNSIEEALVDIWSGLLERDKSAIGVNDSFFELGGHSIKAIRLAARVHERFNVELELGDFFNEPYIESLALEIENILWMRSAGEPALTADKSTV